MLSASHIFWILNSCTVLDIALEYVHDFFVIVFVLFFKFVLLYTRSEVIIFLGI